MRSGVVTLQCRTSSARILYQARDAGSELVVIDIAYRTMASKPTGSFPFILRPIRRFALGVGARDSRTEAGKRRTSCEIIPKRRFSSKTACSCVLSDLKFRTYDHQRAKGAKKRRVDPCVVFGTKPAGHCSASVSQKPAMGDVPVIAGHAVKTEMEMIREAVAPWTLEHTYLGSDQRER